MPSLCLVLGFGGAASREQLAESRTDLPRPTEFGPDDPADLETEFPEPVLALLLPPDDVAGALAFAEAAQVLALAVELAERPEIEESEVRPGDQSAVSRAWWRITTPPCASATAPRAWYGVASAHLT